MTKKDKKVRDNAAAIRTAFQAIIDKVQEREQAPFTAVMTQDVNGEFEFLGLIRVVLKDCTVDFYPDGKVSVDWADHMLEGMSPDEEVFHLDILGYKTEITWDHDQYYAQVIDLPGIMTYRPGLKKLIKEVQQLILEYIEISLEDGTQFKRL